MDEFKNPETFSEIAIRLRTLFQKQGYTKKQIENGILSNPAHQAAINVELTNLENLRDGDGNLPDTETESRYASIAKIREHFIIFKDDNDDVSMEEFMSNFTL